MSKFGERVNTFLRSKQLFLIVSTAIVVFVIVYSFSTLTTKPRLWTDEATSIELAGTFARLGVLDVELAPSEVTGLSHLLQSTGYPTTVPLGLLFRWFGFDFTYARLYMLGWMLIALVAVYILIRSLFDRPTALLSILLIATFASFYGSGRTVVGEIPGFVLLTTGLYFLLVKKAYTLTGIFFGLAIVAKPSVFILLLPVVFILLLREPRMILGRISQFAVGMTPAALLWFAFVGKSPFSVVVWSNIVEFYRNPFGSDVAMNVSTNLSGFFSSTTLIYFSVLFLLVFLARIWVRRYEARVLYDFTIIYSLFAFLYYLRSPGWIRYILIAELLILMLLPHAILTLAHRFKAKRFRLQNIDIAVVTVGCVAILTMVQTVQLFTEAELYYSDSELRMSSYVTSTFPGRTIAVLDSIELATLIPREIRYQTINYTVMPVTAMGSLFVNPPVLLRSPSPEVIIIPSDKEFSGAESEVLNQNYRFYGEENGYHVYTKDFY